MDHKRSNRGESIKSAIVNFSHIHKHMRCKHMCIHIHDTMDNLMRDRMNKMRKLKYLTVKPRTICDAEMQYQTKSEQLTSPVHNETAQQL